MIALVMLWESERRFVMHACTTSYLFCKPWMHASRVLSPRCAKLLRGNSLITSMRTAKAPLIARCEAEASLTMLQHRSNTWSLHSFPCPWAPSTSPQVDCRQWKSESWTSLAKRSGSSQKGERSAATSTSIARVATLRPFIMTSTVVYSPCSLDVSKIAVTSSNAARRQSDPPRLRELSSAEDVGRAIAPPEEGGDASPLCSTEGTSGNISMTRSSTKRVPFLFRSLRMVMITFWTSARTLPTCISAESRITFSRASLSSMRERSETHSETMVACARSPKRSSTTWFSSSQAAAAAPLLALYSLSRLMTCSRNSSAARRCAHTPLLVARRARLRSAAFNRCLNCFLGSGLLELDVKKPLMSEVDVLAGWFSLEKCCISSRHAFPASPSSLESASSRRCATRSRMSEDSPIESIDFTIESSERHGALSSSDIRFAGPPSSLHICEISRLSSMARSCASRFGSRRKWNIGEFVSSATSSASMSSADPRLSE
mmetsp:Transcript_11918/g.28941  ORF Transcript_11918/g.28941 Transcript_11918/m.28941 type:complete len:489 (-) Transcript_11918:639-2105(-)